MSVGGAMVRRKSASEAMPLPSSGGTLSEDCRIARLEEAMNRQLDYVLQNEVADLASRIRDIKAAMDMVRTIKAEAAVRTGDGTIEVSFLE